MTDFKKKWETDQNGFTSQSVSTSEETYNIDLATGGYHAVQIRIDADFPASPTDDLIVRLYASLDGSTWDDTAFRSVTIDKDTDPNQITLLVEGLKHVRVGVQRSGSTDTITVNSKYSRALWSDT